MQTFARRCPQPGHRFRLSLAPFLCLAWACGGESQPPADALGAGGSATGSGGAATDVGTGGAGSGGLASSGGLAGTGGDPGTSSGGTTVDGSGGADGGSSFSLTSPAFETVLGCSNENPSVCDVFPDENVSYMDNANLSPELHWTDAPEGTQSFALVLFDVTYGQAHWALWNIPADSTMVAANVAQDTDMPPSPVGSRQANANFATTSESGYFGPHLPCNVFEFQLYALSTSSFSPTNPDSSVLVSIELAELADVGETVLGVATLVGRSNDYMMTCQ